MTLYYDVSLHLWRSVAQIVLPFVGLLRFDDLTKLDVNCVTFGKKNVILFIPDSKTDQFGNGQMISFNCSNSNSLSPFSYQSALGDFRSVLSSLGLPSVHEFSLHSGRRGGATEAIKRGCDFLTLKRQGRWRSDSCPQLCIDDVLSQSSNFSSFLGLY